MRQLCAVDIAVDVIGLDQLDRLLQLGRVDATYLVVGDVRQPVGISLFGIDPAGEADEQDEKVSAAPEDGAEDHVRRLQINTRARCTDPCRRC